MTGARVEGIADQLDKRQRKAYDTALAHIRDDALEQAIPILVDVIRQAPGAHDARRALANALYKCGRWHEALSHFNEIAERFPNRSDAASNLAGVLSALGHQELAFQAIDRALTLEPTNPLAMNNLAEILKNLGNWAGARDTYEAALSVNPTSAKLHMQYGMTLVALGEWRKGWAEMEYRDRVEGVRLYPEPIQTTRWNGTTSIANKRILITHEQGLGDAIMCARFAKLLAERGATVLLRCPTPLVALLSKAEGVYECSATGTVIPEHDLHVPLMSLPAVLQVDHSDIQGGSYLMPAGSCPSHLEVLLPKDSAPTVAFAWSGNPRHSNDRRRSIAGDLLAPLLEIPGVRYVAMQKFPGMADVLPEHLRERMIDIGGQCADFNESAHALRRVDLVVTVDSAVAHLAGAIGTKSLLCTPFTPDYRWMLESSSTVWYEGTTLLRQPAAYDWTSVLGTVAEHIKALRSDRER